MIYIYANSFSLYHTTYGLIMWNHVFTSATWVHKSTHGLWCRSPSRCNYKCRCPVVTSVNSAWWVLSPYGECVAGLVDVTRNSVRIDVSIVRCMIKTGGNVFWNALQPMLVGAKVKKTMRNYMTLHITYFVTYFGIPISVKSYTTTKTRTGTKPYGSSIHQQTMTICKRKRYRLAINDIHHTGGGQK